MEPWNRVEQMGGVLQAAAAMRCMFDAPRGVSRISIHPTGTQRTKPVRTCIQCMQLPCQELISLQKTLTLARSLLWMAGEGDDRRQ